MGESASALATWFGPVWGGALGIVGTVITGRLKDIVADISTSLGKVDEAANLAEKQLRLHAAGQEDVAGMVGVFTARSELGVEITRQFGRSSADILTCLGLFSDALDACDHASRSGLPLGNDPAMAIERVRDNQQALRRAIGKTKRGALARFLGRKAAE